MKRPLEKSASKRTLCAAAKTEKMTHTIWSWVEILEQTVLSCTRSLSVASHVGGFSFVMRSPSCRARVTASSRPPPVDRFRQTDRLSAARFIRSLGIALMPLATTLGMAHGAELPAHAHWVDRTGWFECDRGYLMRGFACVPEEQAIREPSFDLSGVPSAGEGAPSIEGLGQVYGYRESPAGPQPQDAPPLVIQTDRPWAVILDEHGNPAAVIVGPKRRRHGRLGASPR